MGEASCFHDVVTWQFSQGIVNLPWGDSCAREDETWHISAMQVSNAMDHRERKLTEQSPRLSSASPSRIHGSRNIVWVFRNTPAVHGHSPGLPQDDISHRPPVRALLSVETRWFHARRSVCPRRVLCDMTRSDLPSSLRTARDGHQDDRSYSPPAPSSEAASSAHRGVSPRCQPPVCPSLPTRSP
jgi:hypothetical protein